MIKNVRAMMAFADEQMIGVVKEEVTLRLKSDAYHYIDFKFYPPSKGACIEFGSWGNTYTRLYANKTEDYGGWVGGSKIRTYEESPAYILRDDMMRLAMLKWSNIKDSIARAIQTENAINNFTL